MTSEILAYHEATKHSPESIRRHGRPMDWENRPAPFKRYQVALPEVELPRPEPALATSALDAIAESGDAEAASLDRDLLARILNYGAGVMRQAGRPDGPMLYFRTYASAGGLYPIELYLVTGGLPGLDAGVYHFHPLRRTLRRLREGDWRGWLARASASEPAVAGAEAVLVLTGMPWRTAWKYGDRGFRHLYWDAGMIVANLLAVASAGGVPAQLVHGYADQLVEELLDLDGHSEFPVCLVALGSGVKAVPDAGADPSPLPFKPASLSRHDVEDPAIVAAEGSGRLTDPGLVQAWRESAGDAAPYERRLRPGESREGDFGEAPADTVEAVIRRRGSARIFDLTSIPRPTLATILAHATRGVRSDLFPRGARLVTPYLIVNRVDGLQPGAYAHADGFQLLGAGDFCEQAAYLCLEQWLGGDAAATHFLMADLEGLVQALGDRAYRVAQLEAGVLAGRIYLGAYGYRLGATGLTFFDDAVCDFFAPDVITARPLSCMLVTAVGRATRRLLPLA